MSYLTEAFAISKEIKALREDIHAHPELGNQEHATALRIESVLDGLGIAHRRLTDTAVMATLRGGLAGPTVALRADMDALPITEGTGVRYASCHAGVMHACGHDVHVSAALGAATLLANRRRELPGNVVFLFQPDEESNGGARRMIDAGALEGVSAVFGAHVSPDLPLGHVGVKHGKFYAASDIFRVTVTGRSAHGAEREKGIDALSAACDMTLRAVELPHEVSDRCVVTVGQIQSGTAVNILPGEASFAGIIRTLGAEARAAMAERFTRMVEETAQRRRVTADVHLTHGYGGVVNDGFMTDIAQRAAADLLGSDCVTEIPQPTMTTEDFGEFLDVCPGSFYHIGAGCEYPLHNPQFLPAEDAPVYAAAVHAQVITEALEKLNSKNAAVV